MEAGPISRPTGHVYRVERVRGPAWYIKYRLPDGRQIQKKLGPAWTDRGRPANGYFTKRTAEDWLRTTLEQARRGELPGQVQTGATFADACDEFMRYVTDDRQRKPSTLAGYDSIIRSMLKPAFGDRPVESITTEQIEIWLAALPQSARTSRTEGSRLLAHPAAHLRSWSAHGVPTGSGCAARIQLGTGAPERLTRGVGTLGPSRAHRRCGQQQRDRPTRHAR